MEEDDVGRYMCNHCGVVRREIEAAISRLQGVNCLRQRKTNVMVIVASQSA